jgi:transposase
MRKALSSAERGFTVHDRHRLARALRQTAAARVFRRLQAVLLIAEGRTIEEVAHVTGFTLQSVYNVVQRYLHTHQVKSLYDRPHPGRPPDASELTARQIVRELHRSPLRLGYRTNVWTVGTLAQHLSQRYHCTIAPWTLRRRLKHLGIVCKRPRYFYSEKHPHRAQKKRGHCAAIAAPAASSDLAL